MEDVSELAILGEGTGIYLWDEVTLNGKKFCGLNATFTNDHFPHSQRFTINEKILFESGASIGTNAVIRLGGETCVDVLVGPALVTCNTLRGKSSLGISARPLLKPAHEYSEQ